MSWKYLKLNSAARRLARTPRWARMITRMVDDPSRLQRISTEAALLWELYSHVTDGKCDFHTAGLIDGGLETKVPKLGLHAAGITEQNARDVRQVASFRRWQVALAMDIWGAIAFDMMCGEHGDGSTRPIDRITNIDALEKRIRKRLLDGSKFSDGVGPYRDQDGQPIHKLSLNQDFENLKTLNTDGLRHMVLSSDRKEIVFTDYSTRAFFAAFWACRWVTDEQLEILRGWIPNPYDVKGSQNGYREFWQMVIDMPKDAGVSRREALLSPLYDGRLVDSEGRKLRSTEFIVKAYPLMRETDAVKKFEGEFEELLAGDRGEEKQVIAQNLLAGFLSLCVGRGGEHDRGEFQMGAPDGECREWDRAGAQQNNPLHPVRLSGYFLHRFCVTNEEYELFDARHKSLREFENKKGVKSVDRHPVLNVSSWDGLAFGLWLGERKIDGIVCRFSLPTEAQWEYACRCGEATPFSWGLDGAGERRDGNRIESAYCNFDGNFPWQPGAGSALSKGPYLERTIAVDGAGELEVRVSANPWGFWQMHGNAWEWCRDWYDGGFYRTAQAGMMDPENTVVATDRVLRGGSWIGYGRYCRSSSRYGGTPWYRSRFFSFRLAAVPCEPSK